MKNYKKIKTKSVLGVLIIVISIATITPAIPQKNLVLLHSYDFEDDVVGQNPTGITLSVNDPVDSGSINIDNLGDEQQNHVALHTYISNVDFIKGINYTGEGNINRLDDLMVIDGENFEVKGQWNGSMYEWEIVFEFGADLDSYPLDYYDIYLYCFIEAPNIGGNIKLQAFSTYSWATVLDIDTTQVDIKNEYLERTTKFRLFGETNQDKIVKIDQMSLLITHDGNLGARFKAGIDYCEVYSKIMHELVSNPYVYPYREDPYWWEEAADSNIVQCASLTVGDYFKWESHSYSKLDIKIFYDFDFRGGTITEVNGHLNLYATCYAWTDGVVELSHHEVSLCKWKTPGDQFEDISWINKQTSALYNDFYGRSNNYSWEIERNNINWNRETGLGESRIRSKAVSQGEFWFFGCMAKTRQQLKELLSSVSFKGYGFTNYDYPEIIDITNTREYSYVIDAKAKYGSSEISSVEYLFQRDDWFSDWKDLSYSQGQWMLDFNGWDYENGDYTIWFKVSDDNGLVTYQSQEIEIDHPDSPVQWRYPFENDIIEFPIDSTNFDFSFYKHEVVDEVFLELNGINYGEITNLASLDLEQLNPYSADINGEVTAVLRAYSILGQNRFELGRAVRTLTFRKLISIKPLLMDSGTYNIGNKLYLILYDPNGDRSWSALTEGSKYSVLTSTSECYGGGFSLGVGFKDGIGFKSESKNQLGGGFSMYWSSSVVDEHIISTIETVSITSSTSWYPDPDNVGPGYGDAYWGEVWSLPWELWADQKEYWGAIGVYEYSNPFLGYGIRLHSQALLSELDAPEEWKAYNYVHQGYPEDAKISWLGNYSVNGGGYDIEESYELTDTTTHTEIVGFQIGLNAAIQLGWFHAGVEFKFETKNIDAVAIGSSTKRTFHMEDFDEEDFIINKVGVDTRFGTYIFQTMPGTRTSDPLEHNTQDFKAPEIEFPWIEYDTNGNGEGPDQGDVPVVTVQIADEGGIKEARIRYSIDGGLTFYSSELQEQVANPGTWEGTIPAQIRGTEVLWYVEAIDNSFNLKVRKNPWDNPFSYMIISRVPWVRLIYPNGGEVVQDSINITWEAHHPDNLPLYYSLAYNIENTGWHLLAEDIVDIYYLWDISTFESKTVMIKVIASDGVAQVEDESDFAFTILHTFHIPEVTSPPDIDYEIGSIGNLITWLVHDDDPQSYTIYRNDICLFSITAGSGLAYSIEEPIDITINIDSLSVGIYLYRLEVSDKSGNIVLDEVIVTVYNTPEGYDITVEDIETGVNITFDEVTDRGMTIVEDSEIEPDPPFGFEVAGDYYDITTDASYSGLISLAIPYNETNVKGNEKNLKILHWDPLTGWTDVTTGIDTVNNIIYGEFTEFSTFVVLEKVEHEYIIWEIDQLIEKINDPDVCWRKDTNKDAMKNKLIELKGLVFFDELTEAYDKLLHDIKPKLTGLKTDENEEPWGNGVFKNPWVTCESFQEEYRLYCNEILGHLSTLLDVNSSYEYNFTYSIIYFGSSLMGLLGIIFILQKKPLLPVLKINN